jgi:hypothetical protein
MCEISKFGIHILESLNNFFEPLRKFSYNIIISLIIFTMIYYMHKLSFLQLILVACLFLIINFILIYVYCFKDYTVYTIVLNNEYTKDFILDIKLSTIVFFIYYVVLLVSYFYFKSFFPSPYDIGFEPVTTPIKYNITLIQR